MHDVVDILNKPSTSNLNDVVDIFDQPSLNDDILSNCDLLEICSFFENEHNSMHKKEEKIINSNLPIINNNSNLPTYANCTFTNCTFHNK